MEGEAAMVVPPTAHHSTMVLHFYSGMDFIHELCRLQVSSCSYPETVSSQSMAVLSTGFLSKPCVSALSPCPYWKTHISGWGMQICGMDHLCRTHKTGLLYFPQTSYCALFQQPPKVPLLPLLNPLPVEGLPSCGNLSSLSVSPPGTQILLCFFSSSFSLLSFLLPHYERIFLVHLGVQGPLLVIHQHPMRVFPFADAFLMYLWDEIHSTSSYASIILTPHILFFLKDGKYFILCMHQIFFIHSNGSDIQLDSISQVL